MAVTDPGGAGWRATRRLVTVPPTAGVPDPVPLELPGRGRTVVTDVGPRDAPALVLLHSVACTGLLTWYPALDRLARHHRVVVFDQRWHGRGIRSPEFRLADCAGDVTAVADALGVGRFAHRRVLDGRAGRPARRPRRTRTCYRIGAVLDREQLRPRAAPARRARRLRPDAAAAARAREAAGRRPQHSARARLEDHRWALREFRSTTPWEIAVAVDEIGRFDSTALAAHAAAAHRRRRDHPGPVHRARPPAVTGPPDPGRGDLRSRGRARGLRARRRPLGARPAGRGRFGAHPLRRSSRWDVSACPKRSPAASTRP